MANSKLSKSMADMRAMIEQATGRKYEAPKPVEPEPAKPVAKKAAAPAPEPVIAVKAVKAAPKPEPKPVIKPNFAKQNDELGRPVMKGGSDSESVIHTAVLQGLALSRSSEDNIAAQQAVKPFYGLDTICVRMIHYGNGFLIGLVDTATGQTFGDLEYHSMESAALGAWAEWVALASE